MAANIDANLANWSTTASSNQPDGSDTADLNAEFQQIQAVVRKYMAAKGGDLASASTVDLSAATGNYVHITGTTTITALGTVAAGLRYLLVFDGPLTFTHNATSLILPGGANITTASGDRCEVVSLGSGNWRCLWYAKANGKAVSETASASPGANSDITSLSGLTTPLSVAQGGTGAATLTANNVVLGNGTSAVQVVAPGTSGNVLTSNGTTWASAAPTGGQMATVANATYTTTSLAIPHDDTIPAIGEGLEVLSLAFTPDSASSLIGLQVTLPLYTSNTGQSIVAALFEDSTCIQAMVSVPGAYGYLPLHFHSTVSSGSTSARTYSVRIGITGSGTLALNGGGSRWFGGAMQARLTATEISA